MTATTRTLEITIPDNYTAEEVREHLAKLQVRKPKAGQVAYLAEFPHGSWAEEPRSIRERYEKIEQACREGYVERDKIEAALATRTAIGSNEYSKGYGAGWTDLKKLICEAMK